METRNIKRILLRKVLKDGYFERRERGRKLAFQWILGKVVKIGGVACKIGVGLCPKIDFGISGAEAGSPVAKILVT